MWKKNTIRFWMRIWGFRITPLNVSKFATLRTAKTVFDNQPNRCYKCKYGYVAQNGVCVPCPENASCNGETISCKTRYTLNNGTCVVNCPANCTACSSATTYTMCAAGYSLIGGKCVAKTVAQCPSDSSMSSDGCCCIPK